ncbi:alpha/beta hydrolase [Acidovorax carolinensis]|uniref:Alpha/beta hydrolase n=1 Tax=Acidovorax carolinensis TaxID=553814 RepID=A0A240UJ21_9BURK|nr:alpha/beta hydrolase [Acidovorax carolinensis]ART56571.1 alpha/beta hydrolase [Acidovorax carolinensis]ART61052.1 alpha/beta hydrolase [Acidovorax carolinensis]
MSDTLVSTLSTLTTFTAADGENLAVQDWPLMEGTPRGTVLLVHGLGEHVGRYDALAQRLNAWGFAVRGYDQYGHGESGGPRGGLTSDMRLLDDLADMVDATRARMAPGEPLVLLGHSMGGLVAARFVSMHLRPVDALVLSSPALDPGLNAVQKLLLATLPRILPNLRVGNGLDAQYLSHDPVVVAAYLADPLCHDRISGRLARFVADSGPATVARAAHWSVPTLLMWAGADKLVNPAGSRAFAAAAPTNTVQSQCFESLYHELFNESPELAEPVFALLRQWLLQRCPAVG